jgi:hypothetical protein
LTPAQQLGSVQTHLFISYDQVRAIGYVDPNFPNPNGPNDTSIIIYGYTPSIVLAALATAWFFIFLVVHFIWTILACNCWRWFVFCTGLIFEVIGYIARSLSAEKDPYRLTYFVLNYFFIVTTPVFLAVGIYTILSILIREIADGRRYSLIPPNVILGFFITSDVISTIVQITGAVLVGTSESNGKDPSTAVNILLGGLAYQVFAMSIFVILSAVFILRAFHALRAKGLLLFISVFTLSTLMVYLRTVYRLAETSEGLFGKLATREVYFGCLEFAPIALVALLLGVWHPGSYIGLESRRRGQIKSSSV